MAKLAESRITAQGQISVPTEVRRRLGLTAGSVLEWDVEGDEIVVRRAARFTSRDVHDALFGDAKPRKRSLAELKSGVRQQIQKKHARR